MNKKEITQIVESVTCRECGAIYGYEEHEDMVLKAVNALDAVINPVKETTADIIAKDLKLAKSLFYEKNKTVFDVVVYGYRKTCLDFSVEKYTKKNQQERIDLFETLFDSLCIVVPEDTKTLFDKAREEKDISYNSLTGFDFHNFDERAKAETAKDTYIHNTPLEYLIGGKTIKGKKDHCIKIHSVDNGYIRYSYEKVKPTPTAEKQEFKNDPSELSKIYTLPFFAQLDACDAYTPEEKQDIKQKFVTNFLTLETKIERDVHISTLAPLSACFIWVVSPEGDKFWRDIDININK